MPKKRKQSRKTSKTTGTAVSKKDQAAQAKKMIAIAEAAFSAGYEQALKDQDALDQAFDTYMEDAAKEFEKFFFGAGKKGKKAKTKVKAKKKKARRSK